MCAIHNNGECIKECFFVRDPKAKEIMRNTEDNRIMLSDQGFVIRDKKMKHKGGVKIAIIDGEDIIKNPGGNFNKNPDFTAIVCDPSVAHLILKSSSHNTVLFLDEFTLNSFEKDSHDLMNYMNVMSVAPKYTYLSNANFVGDERIQLFLDVHKKKFPLSTFVNISSNIVFSSSNIWTFSGIPILPHMDCQNQIDFNAKIQLIMSNQFKGRMYNPIAIKEMNDIATRLIQWNFDDEDEGPDNITIKNFIDKLPNLDKIFSDISELYPDNIRKIAMQILNIIPSIDDDDADADNDIIKIFTKIPKPRIKPIDIMNISCDLFPGMNLVGHPDPESFAMSMFTNHLSLVKRKIGSLKKMLEDFDVLTNKWQSVYDSISCGNEFDAIIQKQEFMESKPKIGFTDDLQIGTYAFMKRLGLTSQKNRIPLQIQDIDIDLMKNEDKILLLYSGVGIYSSKESDKAYLDEVLSLASLGKLEFLITDVSYGMDYPFSCVFITKEFSNIRSMNDIYQMICRGGRGRSNNVAQIYIDTDCAHKIISLEDETSTIEVKNMIEVLSSILTFGF